MELLNTTPKHLLSWCKASSIMSTKFDNLEKKKKS